MRHILFPTLVSFLVLVVGKSDRCRSEPTYLGQ